MASSKKRKSDKRRTKRQGLSGNPAKRADQLRKPPDVFDRDTLLDLARLMYGGGEPADWWPQSHDRILQAARASTWPSGLAQVETLTCQLVGDEFYARFVSSEGGLNPAQWLVSLTQRAAGGLRSAVLNDAGDWQGLYALLCGLALICPLPPAEDDETAALAREFFPDILDPYEVAQAEAAKAAKLLADHGLSPGDVIASGAVSASDSARGCGQTFLARDAYGSRFLVAAPFGYGEATDHWYAWDVDQCCTDFTVGAGVFGSAQEALAEWQDSVGAPAATATLAPCPAALPLLLGSCLQTGPISDALMGGEPRELIREYYRMRRRARALAWHADQPGEQPFRPEAAVPAAFVEWHAARHESVSPDLGDAVGTIIDLWGPPEHLDERAFYACSPHRVELTADLLRDGYLAEHANQSLAVLPEWTEWCLAQADPGADFAARALDAARAEAAALVSEDAARPREDPGEEPPFRRPE